MNTSRGMTFLPSVLDAKRASMFIPSDTREWVRFPPKNGKWSEVKISYRHAAGWKGGWYL